MASGRLTFNETWSLIYRLINVINVQFHTLSDGAALTTPDNDFTTLLNTFTQNLGGSRAGEMLDTFENMRADSVNFLVRAQTIYRTIIIEMAKSDQVDSPAGNDFIRAFRDSWLYMHGNNKWARRRLSSFGSTAAIDSPTGTGVWYRVVTDEKGYKVENVTADVTTIECIKDKTTGASTGAEIFEIRGQAAGQDLLEQLGTGLTSQLVVSSESNSLLDTPSFEGSFNATGPTLIGNWETADASKFSRSETFFRGEFSASFDNQAFYIQQDLVSIDKSRPHLAMIRYKDSVALTGNLRLTLGASVANATLGSNNNWNDLIIALNADCWPNNFLNSDPKFKIEATALSGGSVLVDTTVLRPMFPFGAVFNAITAGITDWSIAGNPGDQHVVTDTFSNIGVIQFWTKLLLGRYWPHKPTGSYNLSDPTLV